MSGKVKVEEPKVKKRPFVVCFVEKNLLGRTNAKSLPKSTAVSGKFYSAYDNRPIDEEKVAQNVQKLILTSPNKKYKNPASENQRYGWYNEYALSLELNDPILNHPKHTDPLIFEHLMNYAKIR